MERSAQVECEKLFLTEWLVNMAGINPVAAWIPSGVGNKKSKTVHLQAQVIILYGSIRSSIVSKGKPSVLYSFKLSKANKFG